MESTCICINRGDENSWCRKVARAMARMVIASLISLMFTGLLTATTISDPASPSHLYLLVAFALSVAILATSSLMVILCTPELS